MHKFKIFLKLIKQNSIILIETSKKICKIITKTMINNNTKNCNNHNKFFNRTKIIKNHISRINKALVKSKMLINKTIFKHQDHLFWSKNDNHILKVLLKDMRAFSKIKIQKMK